MEAWVPIPGWPGYEASTTGRIRSLVGPYGRPYTTPKVLASPVASSGYMIVSLHKDKQQYTPTVHSLVAAAFLGPRPEGAQVRHRNGVRMDCSASNLRYGTALANATDRETHGRTVRGAAVVSAKLTADAVRRIKARLRRRQTLVYIASVFGVTPDCIGKIKAGLNWKHIL